MAGREDDAVAHMLRPLQKGTKDYLLRSIVPSLVHGLTQMAIERPSDPHLWMAQYMLNKSRSGTFDIVRRDGGGHGERQEAPARGKSEGKDAKHDQAGAQAAEAVSAVLEVNGLSLLTTVTLDGAEGSMISILDNQSGRNALLELTASQAAALPPGLVEAGDDAATDAWQALRKQLRVTENDEGRLQLDFA